MSKASHVQSSAGTTSVISAPETSDDAGSAAPPASKPNESIDREMRSNVPGFQILGSHPEAHPASIYFIVFWRVDPITNDPGVRAPMIKDFQKGGSDDPIPSTLDGIETSLFVTVEVLT